MNNEKLVQKGMANAKLKSLIENFPRENYEARANSLRYASLIKSNDTTEKIIEDAERYYQYLTKTSQS